MGKPLKHPKEKFETKIRNSITYYENEYSVLPISDDGKLSIEGRLIFNYDDERVLYGKIRHYPNSSEERKWKDDSYTVEIPLTHENLALFGQNLFLPPRDISILNKLFEYQPDHFIIGSDENTFTGGTLSVTLELYNTLKKINSEEGRERQQRFSERAYPIVNSAYGTSFEIRENKKDYGLLLKECIASGEFNQEDILEFADHLEHGNSKRVLIEKHVNKQAEWLINKIEELLEIQGITKPQAKDFGNENFGYTKNSITGAEHLIEKILSDYGQYCLFGVPALLNTDKYVLSDKVVSRSQFDLLLITHLGDVEVVELKKPDERILDFDTSRRKFYPSKALSIAIAQSERYISAVIHDNDEEYKIEGKKIRDYLHEKIGGLIYIETIRPNALILIGSWMTICKDYEDQTNSIKSILTKEEYMNDARRAYQELKSSFKNIKILNYSELLEHARTRFELTK